VQRIVLLLVASLAGTSHAATIATDVPAPAADVVSPADHEPSPPRDIIVGRFMFEPYTASVRGERHTGARFGIDMLLASGDKPTRFASGIRFLLGGDGGMASGPEGQLQLGVAHAISDRAVVALVTPLGFFIGGGEFTAHGYIGVEGVAALGHFAHERESSVRGIEVAAGISTRGARARIGIARPGKEMGFGFGVDWQRDGDAELIGIYIASIGVR
jgi:hypothetical protein